MANSNKYILGINGGVRPGYQDISAVLMQNGKVIAAVEEERLTRIKHLAGQLPIQSVKEVFRIAGISIKDISVVAFHGSTWGKQIDQVLEKHFQTYFGHVPEIRRYHHHDCHVASTFYPSGYDKALVISVDGSGDGVSTQISIGEGRELKLLKRYERPQSLGMYYSMITQLCGFTRDADEYKLMGLAAYGDPSKYQLNEILQITDNGYHFNEEFMVQIEAGQASPSRYEMLFGKKLIQFTGLERRHKKYIAQEYKDLAAAAQLQLEKALVSLVKNAVQETGIKKVCMAGGVALNCLANQKIEALDEVEELFIQPASNDAGISLGAAMLASKNIGDDDFEKQSHTFYGTAIDQEEIDEVLNRCNLNFEKSDDFIEMAAEALANQKVLGWFQGKMEFGPRALGNRSILADPAVEDIQKTVNQKVKFREGFRPFGASVLEEDFQKYFEAPCTDAPYMTKVFGVKKEYQKLLKGVTHVDGTCRVQTVRQDQNPVYYNLLNLFKAKSGHGVLLNTSFNLSHEPIVFSPRDALASFYASGLDELYLGSCIVKK
ncbi:MAG: carbamoyltransferase C-terminal domain-containing protein [Chitinophagales bacterium]